MRLFRRLFIDASILFAMAQRQKIWHDARGKRNITARRIAFARTIPGRLRRQHYQIRHMSCYRLIFGRRPAALRFLGAINRLGSGFSRLLRGRTRFSTNIHGRIYEPPPPKITAQACRARTRGVSSDECPVDSRSAGAGSRSGHRCAAAGSGCNLMFELRRRRPLRAVNNDVSSMLESYESVE